MKQKSLEVFIAGPAGRLEAKYFRAREQELLKENSIIYGKQSIDWCGQIYNNLYNIDLKRTKIRPLFIKKINAKKNNL